MPNGSELEIEANDVRCTHGATIGQLDQEAIFYLQSRGIAKEQARDLLGFQGALQFGGVNGVVLEGRIHARHVSSAWTAR